MRTTRLTIRLGARLATLLFAASSLVACNQPGSTDSAIDGIEGIDGAPEGSDATPEAAPEAAPSPPGTLGAACKTAGECASGFCIEGVCCNRDCKAASCEHCAAAKGAEVDGFCDVGAEPPRARVDTSAPPAGLPQRLLADSEDLQQVIDAAGPGVEIVVPPHRSFAGIVLPARPASEKRWTVIRGNSPAIPPAGERLSKSAAKGLPRLVATENAPALRTAPGARRYWVIGFDLAPESPTTAAYAIAALGDAAATSNSAEDIVLDRVHVHGFPDWTSEVRAAVIGAGARIALVNSRVSEIHTQYRDECTGGCAEARGFVAWNGSGPYRIANNYMAVGTHAVFFGGENSASEAMMPADIEVVGNHLHKPRSWNRGYAKPRWQTKTLLELKTGARVRIEGNRFENEWNSCGTAERPQIGHALVVSPRNGDSTHRSPWSGVRDLAVRDNVFVHASRGLALTAKDDRGGAPTRQTSCVAIDNNLFKDLPGASPGDGRWLSVVSGPDAGVRGVRVSHNTVVTSGALLEALSFDRPVPNQGLVFADNLAVGSRGISAQGREQGADTLAGWFPGNVLRSNDLVGLPSPLYSNCQDRARPECAAFSPDVGSVGFVDFARGDLQLEEGSPARGACSHGAGGRPHDVGVRDFDVHGVGMAEGATDLQPDP